MAVINAYNLNMMFIERTLFKDVSFEVENGEHIGLVGANGTGKTTLFKIITGEIEPTEGYAVKGKSINLGYMEQHACAQSPRTLYDELLSVFLPLIEIEAELEEISNSISSAAGDLEELIARQTYLNDELQRRDGLTFRSRTRATLLGLGFTETDFSLTCKQLSGGQRSKLCLGKLLLSGADVLLLDEPTNHLDIDSVEWLEDFLHDYRGAAIIISHDRYFLDKVTSKTMELANLHLTVYKGNYSQFLKQKQEKAEFDRRHYENQIAEIHHLEDIIEQQKRWGRERNFITAASKQKMLDKKREELIELEPDEAELKFRFEVQSVTGNEVLELKKLSKAFEGKPLFRDLSMRLMRGDRAFVLGPNGCGKTTLLRIIMGEQAADSGSFVTGANVKIGYFDQSLTNINSEKTVLDEMWDEHKEMSTTEVRNALAMFLFRGDSVYKKVSSLSGGEKARLAMLKLVLSEANVLVLDEPTNHLDINSREALEKALLSYNGTMLVVSHDRYFINKLCTRVLHMTRGGFREYLGNYDLYLEKKGQLQAQQAAKAPQKVNEYKLKKEQESEKRRLAGKIKRNETAINETDGRIDEINALLATEDVAADYEQILELTNELEELRKVSDSLFAEWEQLQEQAAELGLEE